MVLCFFSSLLTANNDATTPDWAVARFEDPMGKGDRGSLWEPADEMGQRREVACQACHGENREVLCAPETLGSEVPLQTVSLLAILLNLETCDCWTYPDEDFDRSTRTQDNSTLLLQRRKQPECPRFDLGAQCCLRRLVT